MRTPAIRSDELARFAVFWRHRASTARFPQLNRPSRRRTRGLSQEAAAQLIGCSVGWLAGLEKGEQQNYSARFLSRVADVYDLRGPEQRLLFLLAAHREPPARRENPAIVHAGSLQRFLDALTWPAYVRDHAWNLLASNDTMRLWFPWAAEPSSNALKWALTSLDAREQLSDWRTVWAPLLLGQLLLAKAQQPDDSRLSALATDILASDVEVRGMWEDPASFCFPRTGRSQLTIRVHGRAQSVELFEFKPIPAPLCRGVMLVSVENRVAPPDAG